MALDRDLDLVLITGAGASTALGAADSRLPMMGEWCDALVGKLVDKNYLGALPLSRSMPPADFEAQLGRFLRQVTAFGQVQDVVLASKSFPLAAEAAALNMVGVLDGWYTNTKFHLQQIVDEIHICLYEQFAEPRYDPQRARDAYDDLLTALGINQSSQWIYATTNYDILGETALGLLGYRPDWGDVASPDGNAGQREIQVEQLLDGLPRFTPVLHLHGRVGWYRRDFGEPAVYSSPVTRHQQGFGVPIVMLPDPDKSYDSDPIINNLWLQFLGALQRAQRVFVLGHSLNDTLLARAIRDNVPPDRIAITALAAPGQRDEFDASAIPLVERLKAEFPGSAIIPSRFGVEKIYETAVHSWLQRSQ